MQRFFGLAQDTSGNGLASVSVQVNVHGGSGATIYSDNGVTTKANPFTNDVDGTYEFYAANGRYDVVLTKSGYSFAATETNDILLNDPAYLIPGQCRLVFTNATTITLNPYNGNNLSINGVTQTVPSAGVALAPSTALIEGGTPAASTTYFVYARMVGATMTLGLSATGHATSTSTGVEQRSGDATNTLVGMVRLNATPAFESDNSLGGVLSWFNRRTLNVFNALSGDVTTASTSLVEISTSLRANFLTWGDESYEVSISGAMGNTASGNRVISTVGIDGAAPAGVPLTGGVTASTSDASVPFGLPLAWNSAEGFHFVTLLGRVDAGTGRWEGLSTIVQCNVSVLYRG